MPAVAHDLAKPHHLVAGPNSPNYTMNAGAHLGRGDAFCFDPRVKIMFADPSLKFDFSQSRKEFARGAIREFKAAGERSLVMPVF